MHLNTLKPAPGSKRAATRVGRGIGCGKGKTCGAGHKGQHARSGGYHKVGFEGGQMPLQRRLPKFGFTTHKSRVSAEVRLHELEKVNDSLIDLETLKSANIVAKQIETVKIIASGNLNKSVTIRGVKVTKGAKAAIEAAGGKVEE